MQHQGKSTQDQKGDGWSYEASMKNWRSWGSWFSWGSPVGLGLFFHFYCGNALDFEPGLWLEVKLPVCKIAPLYDGAIF